MSSVSERVLSVVTQQFVVDKNKTNNSTRYVEDLGADSLDSVELVMELEEEFEINIDDAEVEDIHTIGDTIALIEKKLAADEAD